MGYIPNAILWRLYLDRRHAYVCFSRYFWYCLKCLYQLTLPPALYHRFSVLTLNIFCSFKQRLCSSISLGLIGISVVTDEVECLSFVYWLFVYPLYGVPAQAFCSIFLLYCWQFQMDLRAVAFFFFFIYSGYESFVENTYFNNLFHSLPFFFTLIMYFQLYFDEKNIYF